MPRGNVRVSITGDASGLSRATRDAERDLKRVDSSASVFSSGLKSMAKSGALAAGAVGAAGLGAAVVSTVKVTVDFEKKLSSLRAVTEANAKEMARFRAQALKAGLDTAFSAREAAQAQIELAKGGLSVRDIMKGGLRSALALAAAGELELAEAAATTANAINLFGLRGKDSIKVADALAKAANATTADVQDFAMALTQSGGVAKTAGLSFQETVLALEALAASGVKNSDAGTSLKTSIIQLLSPSKKQAELMSELNLKFTDAAGNFKNLSDVSDMLRAKTEGMTRAQRIAAFATLAGTDGVRTLTALYDAGAPKLDKWRQGLGESGTAAEVAKRKQDNLAGAWEQFKGALETAQITLGTKLLPTMKEMVRDVTRFIVQMIRGKGAGGEFVHTMTDIWNVTKFIVNVFRVWIPLLLRLPRLWFEVGKAGVEAGKVIVGAIRGAFNTVKKVAGDVIAFVLRRFADLFDVAAKLPIIGDKFKGIAADVRRAANRVDQLGEEIRGLPSKKKVDVEISLLWGDIAGGGVPRLKADPTKRGSGDPGIGDWIEQMALQRAKESSPLGTLLGGGGIVAVGRILQAMGYQVGEHPAFGGVGGRHTPTSYHYRGRAIDVNADGFPGGEPAALDRIFPFLSRIPHSELLWRVEDHFDHLHFAMRHGGRVPGVGNRDSVAAALTPGEHVFTKDEVQTAGGHGAMFALRRALGGGGQAGGRRFQKGGMVRALTAARAAGFRGDALKTALAVAAAESVGFTDFIGDGGNSHGPWQIHIPSHPEYRGKESKLRNDWTYSARAAFAISGGGSNWSPWSVYNSGAYRAHLDEAAAAIAGGGGGTGRFLTDATWTKRHPMVGKRVGGKKTKFGRIPMDGIWRLEDGSAWKIEKGRVVAVRGAPGPGRLRGRTDRLGNEPLGGRGLDSGPFGGRDVRTIGVEKGVEGGGGDVGGADQALIDALNAQTEATNAHTAALTELSGQNQRLEYLLNKQSPQILDQMRALISTSMMRTVTLGRQAAGQPGRAASL